MSMKVQEMGDLKTVEKRLTLLVGARLEDKGEILMALHVQDLLRKKSKKLKKGVSSTRIIRAWREKRCTS